MSLILSADDREKFVYPFLGNHFSDKKEQLKKVRLTVGDFAISNSDQKILAAFERKTLKDYSAGLKDGRYENVSELIKLRNDTGCSVVFIIENKTSYPSLTKKYGGIPFKNILASIDLLTFRSNIHVIWTKDPEHTATRLHDFFQRYIKIASDNVKGRVSAALRHVGPTEESKVDGVAESLHPSNAINSEYITEFKLDKSTDLAKSAISEKKNGERSGGAVPQALAKNERLQGSIVPQRITEAVDKDDDRLIKEMWHSIGEGLSYNVACIISTKFSVIDLVNKVSTSELKTLTYESGTKFTSKIVKTLTGIKNKDKSLFQKLINGISKIGKASAQKIIDTVTVDDLLDLTPEKIDKIRIDGKRVTAKLESIKKYFGYKIVK
jgi:ERCC4-type nuclease